VTVEVLLDDGWHQRMSNNDGEIIDQAVFVRELTEEGTIFVSADYTQLYRAAAVGLPVAGLYKQRLCRRFGGDGAVRWTDPTPLVVASCAICAGRMSIWTRRRFA
jgi:hypothetical protein